MSDALTVISPEMLPYFVTAFSRVATGFNAGFHQETLVKFGGLGTELEQEGATFEFDRQPTTGKGTSVVKITCAVDLSPLWFKATGLDREGKAINSQSTRLIRQGDAFVGHIELPAAYSYSYSFDLR